MSKNKLTSNPYTEIERKLEKLLIYVINKVDSNTVVSVIKNFERNILEPSIQIDEYRDLCLKKKSFSK